MITIDTLRSRAAERLAISDLNGMQQAMAALKVPCRVVLKAPTGAGKTLAFAIPFLSSLPEPDGRPLGLVIAPTRELVRQIFEVLRTLAGTDLKVCAIYGGHSMEAEVASVAGKPDIIVATPGRLLDHIHRGGMDLFAVASVVLDEYDKSLELGFHKEMKAIMGRLRNVKTVILTSATSAAELPDFIDPHGFRTLDFSDDQAPAPDLDVVRIESPEVDKLDTLADLLRKIGGGRTLVFVNHREAAERVVAALAKVGINAGLYHGALDQDLRERALILFSNGTTPILVATDLAARGLDIPDVQSVVHYHLPISPEVWTHRNGRTGRQGAEGTVYAITNAKDRIPPFATFSESTDIRHVDPLPPLTTLYINAGRREKISRGDVAGFIIKNTDLTPAELGRIDLRDHAAFVAVPKHRARDVIEQLKPFKLKGQRVRVSQIK